MQLPTGSIPGKALNYFTIGRAISIQGDYFSKLPSSENTQNLQTPLQESPLDTITSHGSKTTTGIH